MRVGILALQGCVEPHKPHFEALGVDISFLKQAQDFEAVDAIVLPGGESTTMLTLIRRFGLWHKLAEEFSKKPVWGICAGAILMAREVVCPAQDSFKLIDCQIERNSYGRQVSSRGVDVNGYHVFFIRAPRIRQVGAEVKICATYGLDPVWIKTPQYMATTFHAELSPMAPSPMHHAFVEMVERFKTRK